LIKEKRITCGDAATIYGGFHGKKGQEEGKDSKEEESKEGEEEVTEVTAQGGT